MKVRIKKKVPNKPGFKRGTEPTVSNHYGEELIKKGYAEQITGETQEDKQLKEATDEDAETN